MFDYDPESGRMTWRARPESDFANRQAWLAWNTKFAGTEAGTVSMHGYRTVSIAGKKFKVHRIAFKLAYGTEPAVIDHADGDRLNNSISNLREASYSENNCNRSVDGRSGSGVKGVHWHKRAKKWTSQIRKDGVVSYLGLFATVEEAAKARNIAAKKMHGEFSCDGSRK